jgi:hypothetical protein
VREPEHERDPAPTDERRGEDDVERDHVRDDRIRRQRTCERTLEVETSPKSRPRVERFEPNALRQLCALTALRENDELVDALGKRTDLRNRRGERRMGGIDRLSDEDEAPH